MLTIRLSRVGKKKKPTFRLIVSEKARDTTGTYLELLGNYNPHTNPPTINVKAERIQYWIGQGASASSTVHNLLVGAKVIEAKKIARGAAKKSDKPAEPAKPAAPAQPATPPAEPAQ